MDEKMTCKETVANLKGIFPPVVTPFDRRGNVDEGAFRENLRRLSAMGLSGILVAGSTGEVPLLAERERLRLVELARQVVRPPQILIVGTGLESTGATVRLSCEAVARGADALLVVPPNYYKPRMNSAALAAHYRAVAAGVSRPVIVYSVPQFTGLHMDPETVGRLSRLPNIVGLKESSGDLAFVRAVLRRVRPGFRVLVGSAAILLKALQAGAVGAVLSQATFAPELCVALYEAFRRGRAKAAREFQQRLLLLAQKVALPYGVAGIKAALEVCGYAGGSPRAPLAPLGAAQRRAVAAAIKEARAGLEF
jgi:4-hydroxy-2-oxoglutarate aldolase